jgi:hypothetical protein
LKGSATWIGLQQHTLPLSMNNCGKRLASLGILRVIATVADARPNGYNLRFFILASGPDIRLEFDFKKGEQKWQFV